MGRWAWQTLRLSHGAVDSVLSIEAALVAEWNGDLVVREERGRAVQFSGFSLGAMCTARLDGMVERRWRAAIHGVASLWWSAWIDAGRPNLGAVFDRPVVQWQKLRPLRA